MRKETQLAKSCKIIVRTGDVLVAVGAISANVGDTSLGLGGECYGTVTSVGQGCHEDVMVRLPSTATAKICPSWRHHGASMNLLHVQDIITTGEGVTDVAVGDVVIATPPDGMGCFLSREVLFFLVGLLFF